ncbi:MAG: hypothetical protein P4L65_04060 [Legionella sp.]|nr:hypothetical protein [Legionella sp.]
MNTKKYPINPKKIPYYLALIFLTAGASLILGFLSFGGMFALMPLLPLAIAAFGLSVAYEGEIYLQNIKGALNKLFKNNYLKNHLAKEYLLQNFPANTEDKGCPEFFKDYEKQLKLLGNFSHKHLNKESKQRKKQIEKTLKDMDKWFALQLFPAKEAASEEASDYILSLQQWMVEKDDDLDKETWKKTWQNRLEKRHIYFHLVKAFSTLSALFMGLGSTYLIVEAFTAMSITIMPALILPMAVVAGVAYGLLTYNTVTDFINNDTVRKWFNKIRADLKEGLSLRSVGMALIATLLVGLAIALTICTAGTWWTVATNAQPLFTWMKKIPNFVMGFINPLITGLSAVFFNIENSSESLKMIDEAAQSKTTLFIHASNTVHKIFSDLYKSENGWQMINPFRLIIKLTFLPLRILLFIGHLVSIALTADRMPGLPQIVAALIAMISEGFEDAHYFIGHDEDEHADHDHAHHGHNHEPKKTTKDLLNAHLDNESSGHNHDADIPTRVLYAIASPLYALSAGWTYLASKRNPSTGDCKSLSFAEAWANQWGKKIVSEEEVAVADASQGPSNNWKIEHTVSLLEKYQRKHLQGAVIGSDNAKEKIIALQALAAKVRKADENGTTVTDVLEAAKNDATLGRHRHGLFAQTSANTATQDFIEALPARVGAVR